MKISMTIAGASFEAEGEPAEVNAFFVMWLGSVRECISRVAGAQPPAPPVTVQREMH